MKATDLETLRGIFADRRVHISIGKITQLSLVDDRSELKTMVKVLDGSDVEREIVARMTWESVGPESGFFAFPSAGDLVLIAYAEGLVDQAFVIRRLTSLTDKIPSRATEGHTVVRALDGKQTWIQGAKAWLQGVTESWISSPKIYLAKAEAVPTENLVLGQVLKTLLADVLTQLSDLSLKVSTHTHAGNLGYPTSPPQEAADFVTIQGNVDELKSSPVNDGAILSDIAFTEKGAE